MWLNHSIRVTLAVLGRLKICLLSFKHLFRCTQKLDLNNCEKATALCRVWVCAHPSYIPAHSALSR